MNKVVSLTSVVVAFLMFTVLTTLPVHAADSKVAVINIKKVLQDSKAGISAKAALEKRMTVLKTDLEGDEKTLIALQKEMKKKASAWSEEKKQEKVMELKKMQRNFGIKQEDANMEMQKLQEKHITPIMKKLETIVKEVAEAKKITVVLPRESVLYFDKSINITNDTIKALNAKMK